MKLSCNYHSDKSAQWHCEPCQRFFCRDCVPSGSDIRLRVGGAKCAQCFKRLDYLGSAVGAPSPTSEIRASLLLPLQSNTLFMIIPVALLMSLFSFVAVKLSILLTILPFLILFTLSMEYASTIFLYRSQGESQAPSPGRIGRRPDILFFLRHAVIILLGITFVTAIQHWIAALLYMMYLPAAVIVLANERSLSSALSPLAVIRMIQALGRDYWIAFIFCSAMLACTATAILTLPFIWPFILLYGLYASYAYLGYLMFYHQYELSARIPDHEKEFVTKIEFEKRRALSDSFILLKEKQIGRAREVLKDGFRRCNDDMDLHIQYHKVLLCTDDPTALRNHADFLLDRLTGSNNVGAALRTLDDTLERLPDYRPRQATTCFNLAELFSQERNTERALYLLKEFHQHYAKSELIAEAYLLAAHIFHENSAENKKALVLLNYVMQNQLLPTQGQDVLIQKIQSLKHRIESNC